MKQENLNQDSNVQQIKIGDIIVPYKIPHTVADLMNRTTYTFKTFKSDDKEEQNKRNTVIKDFSDLLGLIENSKSNKDSGWNEKEQRWYPHESVEGGKKTIAYGLKLIKHKNPIVQKWVDLVNKKGFLTDAEAL